MKIKSEKDLDKLSFGDVVEFDFDLSRFEDDEDGPINLLESEEWAEIERLTKLIEEKFSQPAVKPEAERLDVSFDETHILVTSPIETVVKVSGDVRDGEWKLKEGLNKRKLSKDASGVAIDGVTYKVTS